MSTHPPVTAEALLATASTTAPSTGSRSLVPYHHVEQSLARSLLRLLGDRTARIAHGTASAWHKALTLLKARTGTDQQAVRWALTSKVAMPTGRPGCGKSFTDRRSSNLPSPEVRIVLVAPTGRAAKRLTELNGPPAYTIQLWS